MPKYINTDELKVAINRNMDMQDLYLPYEFINLIDITPESIVRCKDCEYYETEGNYCNRDIVKSLLPTEPTDFCSWAERRTENAEI